MGLKIPPQGSPQKNTSSTPQNDNLDMSHLIKVTAKSFRDAIHSLKAEKQKKHTYTEQSEGRNLSNFVAGAAKFLRDQIRK
jgi:hypothetical protein